MSPLNSAIESAEPFDGGPYMTESGWTTTFALTLSNGCIDRGTSMQVYSDGDGKQVKITAGRYFIRGHIYTLTSAKTVPLAALSSGSRTDTVVLRLDTIGRQAYVDVLTGTSVTSGSPTAPSLTQVAGGIWEEPLADVPITGGFTAISSSALIERRTWAGSGTNWTDYPATVAQNYQGSAAGLVPTMYSYGFNVSRYRIDGATCSVHFAGSVQMLGSGCPAYNISLPIAARYPGVVGTANVQNVMGEVLTWPGATSSTLDHKAVQILRYDHGNLLGDGVARVDSFEITYEIAPGATLS